MGIRSPVPLRPVDRLSRASLAGRHPCDYYGHSVAIGLASLRRSHGHYCRTCRARLRRPVRLLQCPDRASLLHPRGLPQVLEHPAAGVGAGFRRLSGGRCFAPSGDWASGNPAFAISRGSPGTPPRTPGHGRRFAWHATVPFTFQIQVKPSDPRTPPPVHARCAGDTAAAPRGAVEATVNGPSGHGSRHQTGPRSPARPRSQRRHGRHAPLCPSPQHHGVKLPKPGETRTCRKFSRPYGVAQRYRDWSENSTSAGQAAAAGGGVCRRLPGAERRLAG